MSKIEPSEFARVFYEQVKDGGVSLNHMYMQDRDTHVMHASWDEHDRPGYLKRTNAVYVTDDEGDIMEVLDYHTRVVADTIDWISEMGWD